MKPCKKMCKECPWRKTSAPGYLGGYQVKEFTDAVRAGSAIPCHRSFDEGEDYDDDEAFIEMLDVGDVLLCHGALKAMQKQCVLSRDRGVAAAQRAVKDAPDDDIMSAAEFDEYHGNSRYQRGIAK